MRIFLVIALACSLCACVGRSSESSDLSDKRQHSVSGPEHESLLTRDQLLLTGKTSFDRYCAPCHGQNGNGVRNLTEPLQNSKIVAGSNRTFIRFVLFNEPILDKHAAWHTMLPAEVAGALTHIRIAGKSENQSLIQPSEVASEQSRPSARTMPSIGAVSAQEPVNIEVGDYFLDGRNGPLMPFSVTQFGDKWDIKSADLKFPLRLVNCVSNCDFRLMSAELQQRSFPQFASQFAMSCISNSGFALCKMTNRPLRLCGDPSVKAGQACRIGTQSAGKSIYGLFTFLAPGAMPIIVTRVQAK